MVKFDFLFKQALVAVGLLASTLMAGQSSVLAATPEAEGSPIVSSAEGLGQAGATPADVAAQPAKNWETSEAPSTGLPMQIGQAMDSMDSMDSMNHGTMNAPSEAEAAAPLALDEDSTAAADLEIVPSEEPAIAPTTETNSPLIQTQVGDDVFEDGETRYRFSYIGIGPNVGITGDPAIGDTSLAIVSRIAFAPSFSARPAVFIEDDVSVLLPVTYDFPISGPGAVAPYVGGGLTLNTGEGDNLELLLSAGLDIPLNNNFAVTAGVNAAPFDEFDMGLFFAVAYTFGEVTTTQEDIEASLDEAEAEVSQAASDIGLSSRRRNPSFIGVGANLGIGGDTALGDTSFAVVSKITVAPSISVRPSLLIEDGVTLLAPVTYDFDGFSTEFLSFFPFIGAGAAFSFESEDDELDLLLTAGVDIPITSNLAFTSSVNAGLLDSFDIGALLGIVYTFGSF